MDMTFECGFLQASDKGEVDLSRFQTLCWNCNFSKHLGDGVCVHVRQEAKK